MNEKIINKLKDKFREFGIDESNFDWEGEWDTSLQDSENETILSKKVGELIGKSIKEQGRDMKAKEGMIEEQARNFKEEAKKEMMIEDNRGFMFEEQANVLVIGRKRSGKTCLGWAFMKQFADYNRAMFVYRHPHPEDLKGLPFKVYNLTNLKQISNLTNAVILIDEADKQFPVLEKAVNSQLRNILSLSGQNNICFIFVCHNSYFINRSLFSFIDIKIIKEVNEGQWELERSYMKKMYENIAVMGNSHFFIDSDYFRGSESFEKPEWFDDKLSFAYRNEVKDDFFSKMREKKQNAEKR